jgi:hypothetical protein
MALLGLAFSPGRAQPEIGETFPDLPFPQVVLRPRGPLMSSELVGAPALLVVADLLGRDAQDLVWAVFAGSRHVPNLQVVLWHVGDRGDDLDARLLAAHPRVPFPIVAGPPGDRAIPRDAPSAWLLSSSGRLLAQGNPQDVLASVPRTLSKSVALLPPDSPLSLVESWLGSGRSLVDGFRSLETASTTEAVQGTYAEAESLLEQTFKNRLLCIRHAYDTGRWTQGLLLADELVSQVRGWPLKEDIAQEILRPFKEPSARVPLWYCARVDRVAEAIRRRGPREEDPELIQRLLRGCSDGPVRRRGEALADLVRRSLAYP